MNKIHPVRLRFKRHGHSRDVILFGSWAIKIPKTAYGWKGFVKGLLCNMNEVTWWRLTEERRLCPVRFSLPGGLLLVMDRAEPLSEAGDYSGFYGFHGLPVEKKVESFGTLDGRVVAIDYGDAFGGDLLEDE